MVTAKQVIAPAIIFFFALYGHLLYKDVQTNKSFDEKPVPQAKTLVANPTSVKITQSEINQIPELYQQLRLAQVTQNTLSGLDTSAIDKVEQQQKEILSKLLDRIYRVQAKKIELKQQIALAKGLPSPKIADLRSSVLDTLESYCIAERLSDCTERRAQYAIFQGSGEWKNIVTGNSTVDAYHLRAGTLMR
jgi:hypothetical protein